MTATIRGGSRISNPAGKGPRRTAGIEDEVEEEEGGRCREWRDRPGRNGRGYKRDEEEATEIEAEPEGTSGSAFVCVADGVPPLGSIEIWRITISGSDIAAALSNCDLPDDKGVFAARTAVAIQSVLSLCFHCKGGVESGIGGIIKGPALEAQEAGDKDDAIVGAEMKEGDDKFSESLSGDYEGMTESVEMGLMLVLVSRRGAPPHDDKVEVSVHLKIDAFDACSPASLPHSPPIPVPAPRGISAGRLSHPAFVLRKALGELFPWSVVRDVALNPKPRRGDGAITAEMVYGAVDNLHCHEFEKTSGGSQKRVGLDHCGRQQLTVSGNDREVVDKAVLGGNQASSESNPVTHEGHGNGIDTAQFPSVSFNSVVNEWCDHVGKEGASAGKEGVRLEIPGLLPRMRGYQEAAVTWMLRREGVAVFPPCHHDATTKVTNAEGETNAGAYVTKKTVVDQSWEIGWVIFLLPKWIEGYGTGNDFDESKATEVVPLHCWNGQRYDGLVPDKNTLYYSPFAGYLSRSYEEARSMTLGSPLPTSVADSPHSMEGESVRGGILAESMGLGKTVEVSTLSGSRLYPYTQGCTDCFSGVL